MKKEKIYIIYKYNKDNNDIEYIKEYKSIIDIHKEYKLKNKKSIYNYIINNIDNIKDHKNLLKNQFVIIKDIIQI